MKKLMKLNIQKFAEEAANETETVETEEVEVESTESEENVEVSNTDAGVNIDKTKAFSNRLKEKTEEIEHQYQEKLDKIAKSKGFDSWEKFEAHVEQEKLDDLGVQDKDKFKEFIDTVIDKNPKILEAEKIIQENKEKEREKYVLEQVEMINKLDSKIKSLDDISNLPNCDGIIDKVNKGYSLYDAYVLENLSNIKLETLNAAKANVINNVNSKGHIKTSSGGSNQQHTVPNDILAMYRKNMPKWSDQQIIDHYNKTLGDEN